MLRIALSFQLTLLASCQDGLNTLSDGRGVTEDVADGVRDACQTALDANDADRRTWTDSSSRPSAASGSCSPIDSNNEAFVGARCVAGVAVAAACFATKLCTLQLAREGFPSQGPFHCTKMCAADTDCGAGLRCCRAPASDNHYCVLPGCGVDCE
jgi:hypothetical protein